MMPEQDIHPDFRPIGPWNVVHVPSQVSAEWHALKKSATPRPHSIVMERLALPMFISRYLLSRWWMNVVVAQVLARLLLA